MRFEMIIENSQTLLHSFAKYKGKTGLKQSVITHKICLAIHRQEEQKANALIPYLEEIIFK